MKGKIIILISSLVLFSLLGCQKGNSPGEGSTAGTNPREQAIAILKTGIPEAEARKEVSQFEQTLADKSAPFREQAWAAYLAKAKERVAKLQADNEARRVREAAEAERWVGAEERWATWISSKKASGHLLDHLLAMRNLGRDGAEQATGGKFVKVPGFGERLTLATDQGIRIEAAYYGPDKVQNPRTGQWDIEAKFTPLTGFRISMANGKKLDKGNVLKLLNLPAGEFKPIKVSWADYAFNWSKLKKPIGNGADIEAHPEGPLVFWTGP